MEHDLSENRTPLFRIMLMDGFRPSPFFVCMRQRRALWHPCLLVQIPRPALPRCALWRADIARRGREDVLPRPPLQRMRHAIECAAQAAGRVPAAAALPAACPVRTSATRRTRRNGGAAARFLDGEAARVLDRAKLRLGFHARLEHGGQYSEVLIVFLFGAFHGQTPRLAARFCARVLSAHDREGIARLQNCGHIYRETGSV